MKVIINKQRNVALLVKQGSRWIHLLRVTAHGLEAEKISEEQLTADWAELASYPLRTAVAKFNDIGVDAGMTEGARALLEEALHELRVGESIQDYYESQRAKTGGGVTYVGD